MINLTCKLSKSESFKAQAAVFLRTFTDPCVASTGAAMLFSLHLDVALQAASLHTTLAHAKVSL